MSDEVLAGLNSEQLAAVTQTEGPVRLIAGAGSGKTRALARRFAYLVLELGISPSQILCVTFTNKAANEMRRRIRSLTGDEDSAYINTFHGFCVSVLQEDAYHLGYPKKPFVLDNADIDAMLALIYEERGLSMADKTFKQARDMFEVFKCKERPDYYLDLIDLSTEALHEKYLAARQVDDILFYGYLYQQKKCFGFDYNDLIVVTLALFQAHPEVALKWQQRLEYIMIDEFQDIDGLQYELMKVLCDYHKNIFIVGDPDQTIYSWRGASVSYLLNFPDDYPTCKTLVLKKNYRSRPEILSVANDLISKNQLRFKKELSAIKDSGQRVLVHHSSSAEDEAAYVAEMISELHEDKAIAYKDIAILYRAHYISRVLEERLIRDKIPYMIYSGVQFYERREVKDVLSMLRMLVYKDDLSFSRIVNVPKRNIGRKRMSFLRDFADGKGITLWEALCRKQDDPIFANTQVHDFIALIDDLSYQHEALSVTELCSKLLERSGYEEMLRLEGDQERLDNVAELKQQMYDFEVSCGEEANLENYLRQVALFSNADLEEHADTVKLMTVHAAKGLEFPWVFLLSLNEGVFPSRRTKTSDQMEEERRLAFVAMTRAEEGLYLLDSEGVSREGQKRYPSRFILEIDEELLDFDPAPPEALVAEAKDMIAFQEKRARLAVQSPDSLYKVGVRVVHQVFGAGTIVAVDAELQSYRIAFDELKTERTLRFRVKLAAEK